MKQFFKMFFASLLAMIVAGFIVFGVIIASVVTISKSITSHKEKLVETGSVLVIDMSKKYHEQGQSNSLAAFSNSPAYEAGLYDLTRSLASAKTDANIKGILVKLGPTPNGWATIQELRAALTDFKTSGKFVYAYGEDITQGAYFVATVADSIYLNPVGSLELKGLATVMPFFKGALDKLELQPEIFYAGKFKSATEPFRADKMSEPNKLQIAEYQRTFWTTFISAVSTHTHTDTAAVNQLAATGAIQFPEDALKYKLVDGLLYWDQVEQRIKNKTGQGASEHIKYVTLDEYAGDRRFDTKVSDQRIAIIFAEGDIVGGEQSDAYQIASKTLINTIRKVKENDRIKAVVLRVNSPGGSALASDVILRELQLLKQKKPLIVSMGDYAASGGYYISCMADSIFAQPTTLTGSIGVFSVLFNIQGLMTHKLGVTFDEVKNEPYADLPTTSRPLNADESARMQHSVDYIYSIFKSRVVAGRHLSPTDVDSIAQGRVWTGQDAIKIGLVDGLGNLDRAITSAAKMAKLNDYKVVTYPEVEDKLENMLRRFKNNSASAAVLTAAVKEELGDDYTWYEKVKSLRSMNGKTMMEMPFMYNVN